MVAGAKHFDYVAHAECGKGDEYQHCEMEYSAINIFEAARHFENRVVNTRWWIVKITEKN